MSPSPIKRDKSLVVLSKEHHLGLLACWKIRQGITYQVEPERIRNYVNYFWESHLVHHFKTEEDILFRDVNSELVTRAIVEHVELKTHLDIINEHVDNEKLSGFADLLMKHIRFEERELFNFLQISLSEKKLVEIAEEIDQFGDEPFTEDFKDTFWLKA